VRCDGEHPHLGLVRAGHLALGGVGVDQRDAAEEFAMPVDCDQQVAPFGAGGGVPECVEVLGVVVVVTASCSARGGWSSG